MTEYTNLQICLFCILFCNVSDLRRGKDEKMTKKNEIARLFPIASVEWALEYWHDWTFLWQKFSFLFDIFLRLLFSSSYFSVSLRLITGFNSLNCMDFIIFAHLVRMFFRSFTITESNDKELCRFYCIAASKRVQYNLYFLWNSVTMAI